ncbi:hypothetical protein PCORN_04442 [Listeria cornellensis FSL F6-0969]|uniref:Uncharacterized protein n=2 Tax=Listeria cornellensis TaxID=1494961 RepID=W7BXG6_9LIST|nr:hypothetical protein PCORN_04442 [Listeria cornellensis FSL F6-0969]
MVVNTRIKQGHFVKINPELKKLQTQMDTYRVIAQLAEILIPILAAAGVPEDEIVYMDLLTMDTYVYSEDKVLSGFHTETEMDAVDTFLMKSFQELGLGSPEKSELTVFIAYLRNQILLSKLTPLFQKKCF